MKLRAIIFSLLLTLITLPSLAGRISAHRGTVPNAYNFWLVEPDDSMEAKPVFIFLHGASLCGNDPNRVKRYGTLDAVQKGRNLDAYIIAPQNPGGAWKPEKIMNILKWVEDWYNVDYDRIYVLGMSLGGYGTIDFVATYPDDVAAAMAFCGGGSVKDLTPLNNVPLWIVHGTADAAVSISQSDKVVSAMREADASTPRLIYDRMPGWNHGKPARLFYLAETYDWLLSHSLKDHKRPVKEGFKLTNELLGKAYSSLRNSGKSSKKTAAKQKQQASVETQNETAPAANSRS